MKTCILWLSAALATAAINLAWSQVPEARAVPYTMYGQTFYVEGVSYVSDLYRSNILSSPLWSPSAPLPLNPSQAVETARGELKKLLHDDRIWKVTGIDIKSLAVTPDPNENAWYFCIHFEPTTRLRLPPGEFPRYVENAAICIDFAGRPGVIRNLGRDTERK